jgi:hypothetical protein
VWNSAADSEMRLRAKVTADRTNLSAAAVVTARYPRVSVLIYGRAARIQMCGQLSCPYGSLARGTKNDYLLCGKGINLFPAKTTPAMIRILTALRFCCRHLRSQVIGRHERKRCRELHKLRPGSIVS